MNYKSHAESPELSWSQRRSSPLAIASGVVFPALFKLIAPPAEANRYRRRAAAFPVRCRGDLVRFVCHRARRTFVDRELEHIGPRVVTDDIEV